MRWFSQMALLVLVALGGCKGCNEDACPSTRRTNAGFRIEEYDQVIDPAGLYLKKGWQFYETDTVTCDEIRLTPYDMNAERYEWIIGTDTLKDKQPIVYGFAPGPGSPNEDRRISIKLTTWKTPDRGCFPNDSGVATTTRIMTARFWQRSKIYGQWLLYLNGSKKDTTSFRFYTKSPDDFESYYTGALMKPDCNANVENKFYGFRQGIFDRNTCLTNNLHNIQQEFVHIMVDPLNHDSATGTLTVVYQNNLTKKEFKFTAKRQQP